MTDLATPPETLQQQTAQVYALVNGEPIEQLPDDLYIPANALEVVVEFFEGPLDLLLYLIKRQNLDILDIPIAQITRQYIAYIQLMDTLNLDLAAEYLVMAALLAEIKSRLLLPRPPDAEDGEEDPRAMLIRKLQEYECIKQAAEDLDAMPRLERDLFLMDIDTSAIEVEKPLPEVHLKDMLLAFFEVLQRAERFSHHHISREPLSVRERMTAILDRLRLVDSLGFSQLFLKKEGRQGVVVSFLAVLELSKECLVQIIQEEPFAEIRVIAATVSAS